MCVGQQAFTYDHVFGACGGAALPSGMYPRCVQPLVEALFKGYNATVFAYGQTGSGKTFTMGSAFEPGVRSVGVIPSVMEDLYARVAEGGSSMQCAVRVSFVEINKVGGRGGALGRKQRGQGETSG